jgi:NACHT domain
MLTRFVARAARQTFSNSGQVINDLSCQLIALKQSFDVGISLQTVFTSTRTLAEVDRLGPYRALFIAFQMLMQEMFTVNIENLKHLNPVRMDASSRPECLPETRQDVLKFITDWLTTPSDDQNTLWLYGLAGCGKSTVATTIAEYFRELGRLGAFLFFDRNNPTNSEPSVVIRTLSYKLASFDPTIRAAVCAQIERDPSITEAATRVQFAKLLREPFTQLGKLQDQGPIVIILDAFDECGDPISRKGLLALIAQELAKLPPIFRFVITSRRIPDIDAAFFRQPNIVARELDIANTLDISSYFHHHMSRFREHPAFRLASDWPGEETVKALAQSSGGLFIWASTAVKFIAEGHHPDQQLGVLLRPHPGEAESVLDALYATALGMGGNWDRNEVAADFREVLGTIVMARVPLRDTTIDRILGLDGPRSSCFILSRLHCLLHWSPGKPVRTLHVSFIDYLTDAQRSGSHPWFIDSSTHHRNLVVACFRIMKAGLRFNICKLETSHLSNNDVPDLKNRIKNCIHDHLSYACRFWAEHLQETIFEPDVQLCLDHFLHRQLLHWLEVLSLIKEVHSASSSLQSAALWTLVSMPYASAVPSMTY